MNWTMRAYKFLLVLWLTGMAACGDDEEEKSTVCEPGDNDGCDDGLVCEMVQDGEPACFAKVVIRGRVFDLMSDESVEDATVVALDVNGAAVSNVVLSHESGSYELQIPMMRDSEGIPLELLDSKGEPLDPSVQLRVSADGYQSFPFPPRTALPIDLTAHKKSPESEPDVWLIENPGTDVGLIDLPGNATDRDTIQGRIDGDDPGGALVVAVQKGKAVATAISDSQGAFTLFNVPHGETSIEAYRAGLNVAAQTVNVPANDAEAIVLQADTTDLASVTGSINIVNAPGGSQTSVILVLESTFIESTVWGIAPSGLRIDGVESGFNIADVPPGNYVVLAAFENDDLVRDPDESIGGTNIVHIEVTSSDSEVDLPESFKVTEALDVLSPGAAGLELIDAQDGITFRWADDSSEDGYELRIYDAFGNLVHENTEIDRVTGGDSVNYTWSDATLERGMVYQFRVVSFRDDKDARTYISATEDLKGVFQIGEES